MKAVILAGGLGTRLRPVIGEDTPKVMLDYAGKPLLERTVEILKSKGFDDLVFVVSHNKEKIMNHFGDGSKHGVKIEYVSQQNPKGGTADAVRCAREKIESDSFLLVYGDNIFSASALDEVMKNSAQYKGILCGKEVDDPRKYGILETNEGKVSRIIEKPENPTSKLAMTGLLMMPREIFSAIDETKISQRGELELTDSIQILIDRGLDFGFVSAPSYWFDPRDGDEIEKARSALREN